MEGLYVQHEGGECNTSLAKKWKYVRYMGHVRMKGRIPPVTLCFVCPENAKHVLLLENFNYNKNMMSAFCVSSEGLSVATFYYGFVAESAMFVDLIVYDAAEKGPLLVIAFRIFLFYGRFILLI